MANTRFKLKKSSVAGKIPTAGDLQYGELALNFHDGKIYYKNDSDDIRSFTDDIGQDHYDTTSFDSDFHLKTTDELAQGTTNKYYTTALFDSDLSLKTTDDISEGAGSLYYTTARADSDAKNAISVTDAGGDGSLSYDNANGVITYTGPSAAEVRAHFSATGDLSYDSSTGVFSFTSGSTYTTTNFDSDFGTKSTTDLAEGTNLYYTSVRVDSDFDSRLATKSTTDLSEGTNLYYTTARADSDITAKVTKTFVDALNINADTLDGQQGTYYLDYTNFTNTPNVLDSSDVISTISAAGYATQTYVNNAVAALPDSAQVSAIITADVTTSFVNALNVDANTLNGQSGTHYLDYTNFTNTPNVLDSADVRNIFSVSGDLAYNSTTGVFSVTTYKTADFNTDFGTKSTTDLSEGTNLYYTTARADSDAKNAISVTDAGGDGSLSYNNSTGVITYTGPSAAEVRAHFSGANGINYNSSTGKIALDSSGNAVLNSLTTTDGLTVGGNLQVLGTTTTVNSQNLEVEDNMIYMNATESAGSPTQLIDVGWAANVNDDGSYQHVGMFRDATDNTFKVYENYSPEPDAAVEINTGHASFQLAPFAARTLTGQYLGFDSDFGTKSTTNLSEGTNLYYTSARADSDAKNAISVVDAGGLGSLTYNSSTGVITYTGPDAPPVAFSTVAVSGQSDVVADSTSDTLTLIAGENITITTSAAGDSITFASTGGGASVDSDFVYEASTALTTTAADQVVDTFLASKYRSAKYLVQMTSSTKYQASEVLVIHNGSTTAITEYGVVRTDSDLGSVDADVSAGSVRLLVTPSLINTTVNVKRVSLDV